MSERDARPAVRKRWPDGASPLSGPGAGDGQIDLRETYRTQMLASIGGWSGTLITALPTVVFVVVNATTALRPAILAAVATALGLAGFRLARKQSTQQALSGLFGVLVAALIAARTGQARGYFLLGIWSSFAYAVPFVVSLVVRRPLVGILWEFLDPSPAAGSRESSTGGESTGEPSTEERPAPTAGEQLPWYRRRRLFRAYVVATVIGAVLFLSRGAVQATLYHRDATGWLAVARLVMGYPLYALALVAAFWVVRRARHAEHPPLAEVERAQDPGLEATGDEPDPAEPTG